MKTKAFRLPEELAEKLEKTAKKTNRTETFYVIEALNKYFSEQLDYQIAMDRFLDAGDKTVSLTEMKKRLGL